MASSTWGLMPDVRRSAPPTLSSVCRTDTLSRWADSRASSSGDRIMVLPNSLSAPVPSNCCSCCNRLERVPALAPPESWADAWPTVSASRPVASKPARKLELRKTLNVLPRLLRHEPQAAWAALRNEVSNGSTASDMDNRDTSSVTSCCGVLMTGRRSAIYAPMCQTRP